MVVISPGRGPGSWPRQPLTDTLIDTTEPAKMVSRATLICRPNSHPFQERHLALEKPEKIGRSVARARAAPNNAIFDCKVLSRNHALIWFDKGKFFLKDTKSSNGTFVNSQRLTMGVDESPPRELWSGDIVQFGVDVMENSKKVTHGCIVATLKLYLPDGNEAKPSDANIPLSQGCPVRSPELYRLQQCVQEAIYREQSVESKLATLQRLMDSVKTATDSSWKALIDEDRLLTRLEMLEGQHALYSKNFGEDKLREEIARLQEDKNTYQNVAKESLKKVLQEKLEAVRRLEEAERALSSAEEESRHQQGLRDSATSQLADLAEKYESKMAEAADLETKVKELEANVKELEEEQAAAEQCWHAEWERVEARGVQQRSEEAKQRARLEGLQAESDFTRQQLAALRHKLNGKLADTTPNGDISCELAGMEQTELELQTVRHQLTAAESQLSTATLTIAQLKDDIKRVEAEVSTFKEKACSLEVDLTQGKREVADKKDEVLKLEQDLKDKETELQKLTKQAMQNEVDDLPEQPFLQFSCEQNPEIVLGDAAGPQVNLVTQRSAGGSDIKDSAKEMQQLKSKVETLNELLSEARQSRADCETRVERFESDLLVTRNNAQEATLRADHLRTQLKEAESGLAVRSERQDQLQQQLVRLAASVTEAVCQLQQLQQRHDQQHQAAVDGASRADKLQESLSASEARLAEASRDSDSLRQQLAELRAETESVREAADRRQQALEMASERLHELQQRLSTCSAERDLALAAAASPPSAVGASGEWANPAATAAATAAADDDAEKAELRKQLRRMDEQLKELSLQNRTATACSVVPLMILAWSVCVAFYDWLASFTATRGP